MLLSAQTKGQLELDVVLGAAGRGLAERKYEGQGRGSQSQSNRQRDRPKRDRGPRLSKIRDGGDTGSPTSIKMGRERKKLCV